MTKSPQSVSPFSLFSSLRAIQVRPIYNEHIHFTVEKVIPGLHIKADCTWGRLYSQMSFIYKYKTLRGFIKGVSGGCFVLIKKWCYVQSAFMYNPGPTYKFYWWMDLDCGSLLPEAMLWQLCQHRCPKVFFAKAKQTNNPFFAEQSNWETPHPFSVTRWYNKFTLFWPLMTLRLCPKA